MSFTASSLMRKTKAQLVQIIMNQPEVNKDEIYAEGYEEGYADVVSEINTIVDDRLKTSDMIKEITKLQKEIEELKEANKTLEDIHNGDMKIAKMLKEKWNEEQAKNAKLQKTNDINSGACNDAFYAQRKIAEQQEEIAELKETCLKWQEKADFNLGDTDSDDDFTTPRCDFCGCDGTHLGDDVWNGETGCCYKCEVNGEEDE